MAGATVHAAHPASFSGGDRQDCGSGVAAVFVSQARGIARASRNGFLLAVVADHRLQGAALAPSVGILLSRPAAPGVTQLVSRLPPAVFPQHPADLVAGPAVSI